MFKCRDCEYDVHCGKCNCCGETYEDLRRRLLAAGWTPPLEDD